MALALVLLIAASLWWAMAHPGAIVFWDGDGGVDSSGAKSRSPQALRSAQPPSVTADYEVRQALFASGILAKTDPVAATVMAKRLQPIAFPPGCSLDGQDDFGLRLYVIVSGKAKVSYRRDDGHQVVLAILGPSEILGAITLFDPDARELSVTTLTDVVAVPIERRQLLRWMAERQEVADQVLRLFARWVKRTTDLLVDVAFSDTDRRIAGRLLLCSQRFGRQEQGVVRIVHDLTFKDFARFVGVAPETVYLTLLDFQRRGWIQMEGHSVVISDGQALRSMSTLSGAELPGA